MELLDINLEADLKGLSTRLYKLYNTSEMLSLIYMDIFCTYHPCQTLANTF